MMGSKRRREIENTNDTEAAYRFQSESGSTASKCFSVSYLCGESQTLCSDGQGILNTLLIPTINQNLMNPSLCLQSAAGELHVHNTCIPWLRESDTSEIGRLKVNYNRSTNINSSLSNVNNISIINSNINQSIMSTDSQSNSSCRKLHIRKSPSENTDKTSKILLPKTAWMCFSADTKILTAENRWLCVSDLPRRDEPLTFSFCQYDTEALLTDFRDSSGGTVTARVSQSALFYVRDKGWCAIRPSVAAARYQAHVFLFLNPGDLCQPVLFQEEISLESPSTTSRDSNSSKVKRPMNSFMLFAKKYRLELTRLHPGRDNRDISILLGERWRKLSSEEKRTYAREAQALAEVHKKSHPDCWKRKKSK